MFTRTWAGTEQGCYFRSQNEVKSYSQIEEELSENGEGSLECELPIPEVSEVEQIQFNGNYICGTRGGLPFKSAQRPLLSSGACTGDLEPCNEGTTVENTICYDPE